MINQQTNLFPQGQIEGLDSRCRIISPAINEQVDVFLFDDNDIEMKRSIGDIFVFHLVNIEGRRGENGIKFAVCTNFERTRK